MKEMKEKKEEKGRRKKHDTKVIKQYSQALIQYISVKYACHYHYYQMLLTSSKKDVFFSIGHWPLHIQLKNC